MSSLSTPSSDQPLQCMEICGGHRDGMVYYQRPGLDIWVLSRVKQDTTAGGGELHLISSCASGRITRTLMADICGFGPLYNGVASRMREVLKRNVNTIKQTRSVQQMSEQLEDAARHGGFASTLMSTFFAPTRTFTACNAGHPPPMLYRRNTRKWSLMKQSAVQDVQDDRTDSLLSASEYQQVSTKLEIGDMVLTCSNNLAEARCRAGQTIGIDALLGRVQQLNCDAPHEIPQQLFGDIVNERSENLSETDTTIVLCKATETRVHWRDNVLAPFRLFRSVTDRTSIA